MQAANPARSIPSGALFGIPIALPTKRTCKEDSTKGQRFFMEQVRAVMREATPYRVQTLDRLIPLTGTTAITPQSMREFEKEMVGCATEGKPVNIKEYVYAIRPREAWPRLNIAVGVVAHPSKGVFSLPPPDVWQMIAARLHGYLGYHVPEFADAHVGQIGWLDDAVEDGRRILMSQALRCIDDGFDEEGTPVKAEVRRVQDGYQVLFFRGKQHSLIQIPARNGRADAEDIARVDHTIRSLIGSSASWSAGAPCH